LSEVTNLADTRDTPDGTPPVNSIRLGIPPTLIIVESSADDVPYIFLYITLSLSKKGESKKCRIPLF